MKKLKKSWEYQNGSDRVVVNYDYNFGFNNHFGKTITINDEIIFQSKLNFFMQSICVSKGNLKVVLGKHLGLFRRCHIYEDDRLVGGDVEKQLYVPSFLVLTSVATYMAVTISLISIVIWAIFSRSSDEEAMAEINKKIKSNDVSLSAGDIRTYFEKNNHSDIKKEKFSQWLKKCNEGNPEFCKLTSYLYSADNLEEKALIFALKGCRSGGMKSCLTAFENKTLIYQSPDFIDTTNALRNFCLDKKSKNESDQEACYYFAKENYRFDGNFENYKLVNTQLCEQKLKLSCKRIKWLEHQKNEICLTGKCKSIYE